MVRALQGHLRKPHGTSRSGSIGDKTATSRQTSIRGWIRRSRPSGSHSPRVKVVALDGFPGCVTASAVTLPAAAAAFDVSMWWNWRDVPSRLPTDNPAANHVPSGRTVTPGLRSLAGALWSGTTPRQRTTRSFHVSWGNSGLERCEMTVCTEPNGHSSILPLGRP